MKATSLFLCSLGLATTLFVQRAEADPIPDEFKQNGFAIGAQAYTFNRFTVFEAIEKTAQAGGKVIEFFPGQKLSKEDQTAWKHGASDETIAKVQAKLKEHGIKAVNYGVVGARDAAEWRQIFEFGKKLGLYAITTEDATKLDIIEPLVKEFDIRLAIHDHPRRPNNPDYKVWDPHYIVAITKGRDQRIGACADTGTLAELRHEPRLRSSRSQRPRRQQPHEGQNRFRESGHRRHAHARRALRHGRRGNWPLP
jgi:hypothetical protein